jgi:hypothetical protein
VYRNTGGAPLFVVESLQLMRTQAEIFRDAADNKWSLLPQWEDDLPSNVEAVIEERVARLPEELLEILWMRGQHMTRRRTSSRSSSHLHGRPSCWRCTRGH